MTSYLLQRRIKTLDRASGAMAIALHMLLADAPDDLRHAIKILEDLIATACEAARKAAEPKKRSISR